MIVIAIRMDLLHGILHYVLKRNYLVPIHKPRAILDIGTGTGIWVRVSNQCFILSQNRGNLINPIYLVFILFYFYVGDSHGISKSSCLWFGRTRSYSMEYHA
jgi:hypothetical protein